MTEIPQTIHVIDDDDSFRIAMVRLLMAAGYEARGYPTAGEFLMARPDGPGCIVLDVRLPGPSGLDFQEAFSKDECALPIIFLTGHGDIPMSVRAMKAGAVDFLTKPVQKEALLSAVQSALAQNDERRRTRERATILRSRLETLTPRERSVFDSVVAGKLNKQIAITLDLSERTVKAYRSQVMEKLEAGSLAELVHIAEQFQADESKR